MVNVGKDSVFSWAASGRARGEGTFSSRAEAFADFRCSMARSILHSLRAANRSFGKSLRRRRRAQALLRDGKDHGEGIVHPMGELAQQHGILLLGVCGR